MMPSLKTWAQTWARGGGGDIEGYARGLLLRQGARWGRFRQPRGPSTQRVSRRFVASPCYRRPIAVPPPPLRRPRGHAGQAHPGSPSSTYASRRAAEASAEEEAGRRGKGGPTPRWPLPMVGGEGVGRGGTAPPRCGASLGPACARCGGDGAAPPTRRRLAAWQKRPTAAPPLPPPCPRFRRYGRSPSTWAATASAVAPPPPPPGGPDGRGAKTGTRAGGVRGDAGTLPLAAHAGGWPGSGGGGRGHRRWR